MKKLTSLFFTFFIVLLLSACTDVAAITIGSNNIESNEQQISSDAASSSEPNSLVNEFESLITELISEISELRFEMYLLENKKSNLINQISNLQEELSELENQNTGLYLEYTSLDNIIEDLKSQQLELKSRLASLKEEYQELSTNNHEFLNRLEELERKINIRIVCDYNNDGHFLEEDNSDWVLNLFSNNSDLTEWFNYIFVDYPSKSAEYTFSCSKGLLGEKKNTPLAKELKLTAKNNSGEQTCFWFPDEDIENEFVQVVIEKDDDIVGYAVLKAIKVEIRGVEIPKLLLLKGALISVIDDNKVTIEQVQSSIDAIKARNMD